MSPTPRMLLILSENWTLASGRDLPRLVEWAREAEDAGFDSVMLSEHVVLGPDAGARGIMANPRAYAAPGNQDPATPWPNSLLVLSAIAAVTTRIRLVASAILAPLRRPLLLARDLGTLDLLSAGRLVVQPGVSWSRDEYAALGVPFGRRGRILDEQLAVLETVWAHTPATFHGEFFDFDNVYLEPKAYRSDGPRLWFGGQQLHGPVLERLIRYGHGFHPFGTPTSADLATLRSRLASAGRDLTEIELVGGTRATFTDDHSCADLGAALAPIAEQWEQGYTTFCVKPSQFIDDPEQLPALLRDVARRVDQLL